MPHILVLLPAVILAFAGVTGNVLDKQEQQAEALS